MKNKSLTAGSLLKYLIAGLMLVLWDTNMVFAQLCPSSITCQSGLSLSFQFNNGPHDATELFNLMQSSPATITFGENSPLNGSYYSGSSIGHNGNTYHFLIEDSSGNPVQCENTGILPSVSIVLPNGESCVYEYNLLCTGCPATTGTSLECEEWVNACSEGLVDLINADPSISINGCEQWSGDCGIGSVIERGGVVGIGVSQAPPSGGGFNLYVNGGILTEQFKLADPSSGDWGALDQSTRKSTWCDYVFNEGYPLMPLGEVEKFIDKNHHLPNTPSAGEIKEQGGYMLRETILNHQEKIEEAFLHLIELDNQLEGMESTLKNNQTKKK